jgi:urate oxidase
MLHAWSKNLVQTEERRINRSGPETHVFLDEVDLHWVQQLHHVNHAVLLGEDVFHTALPLSAQEVHRLTKAHYGLSSIT